ncbi:holin [Chromobacterium haemolyticum]|uniref:Holin n=1 Tax=Chromobacterium fluminis TaxID=3044269 RepID=A0ABX0L1N3_9NEIS|nr:MULTISPECIES: phage holin family protein [Chromobacterium]KMN36496.1 holin [Chromobacterium sp. LK1]NHR05724.1 holin [Chromobacterium haemolyticum]OQS41127.1 holin [Chromobacterium haemolyticum]
MQEHEKGVLYLVVIGAVIGLGKLLVSSEKITGRLALGRAILGGATSTVAGVVLAQFPTIPLPALIGVGSALGILGAQFLEAWLKTRVNQLEQKP